VRATHITTLVRRLWYMELDILKVAATIETS
jgi:hypothetical protein